MAFGGLSRYPTPQIKKGNALQRIPFSLHPARSENPIVSTVDQIAIPFVFQQVIKRRFECSNDEISMLEASIERAREQYERNADKAVKGCKCQHCQDVRYFNPNLPEVSVKPGIPSLQNRGRA
jgi:hypothetical protein